MWSWGMKVIMFTRIFWISPPFLMSFLYFQYTQIALSKWLPPPPPPPPPPPFPFRIPGSAPPRSLPLIVVLVSEGSTAWGSVNLHEMLWLLCFLLQVVGLHIIGMGSDEMLQGFGAAVEPPRQTVTTVWPSTQLPQKRWSQCASSE